MENGKLRQLRAGCLGHTIACKLPLDGRPVEVGVLAGNATVAEREDVYAVASERVAVDGTRHLVLRNDVILPEMNPLAIKPEVRALREDRDNRLPDGRTSFRWITGPMRMKHSVIGVQRDNSVNIVGSPGCPVADSEILISVGHWSSPFVLMDGGDIIDSASRINRAHTHTPSAGHLQHNVSTRPSARRRSE
jgi:hypothetical protein